MHWAPGLDVLVGNKLQLDGWIERAIASTVPLKSKQLPWERRNRVPSNYHDGLVFDRCDAQQSRKKRSRKFREPESGGLFADGRRGFSGKCGGKVSRSAGGVDESNGN